MGDDANINVEEKGVVVSFKASAYFKPDSANLSAKGTQGNEPLLQTCFSPSQQNSDRRTYGKNTASKNWDSTWELAGARASKVARFFIKNGLDPTKITVKSFGSTRPRFREASLTQRSLNNRVEVVVLAGIKKPDSIQIPSVNY